MQDAYRPRNALYAGLISGMLSLSVLGMATAADKSGYKIGDRLPQAAVPGSTAYKEMQWDALAPANWNPAREFEALNLGSLSDSDPRAIQALEKLRIAMDNAPVVPALNGARVRIAGFLVPLDGVKGQITEFLLVPYFGACIHTPPPPANQIIHVVPAKPYKLEQGMDAVWINGVLETTRAETGMGNAGYRMKADLVTPYKR
ncbi:MAG: DUF3299 domain-containing protein [Pseudomonadota bacterium]